MTIKKIAVRRHGGSAARLTWAAARAVCFDNRLVWDQI